MLMQLRVLSKLLSATRSLCCSAYLCFALAMLPLMFYMWHDMIWWAYLLSIMALCLTQHFLCIRIQFDVDLLNMMTTTADSKNETASLTELTTQLDHALVDLQLIPPKKIGRNWNLRMQGCMRLFKIQITLLILQYIIFIFLIKRLIQQ